MKFKLLILCLVAQTVVSNLTSHDKFENKYHHLTYQQVVYKLKRAAVLYPETVQIFSAHSFPMDPAKLDS